MAIQDWIGKYARSIESGWAGKVVAIEKIGCDWMLRMHGLDHFSLYFGSRLSEAIDCDDVQWFSPSDVEMLQVS